VIDTTPDKRWLKVRLPHNHVGYVPSALVASGFRLPK
jgi:hypothetical protein